MRKFDKKFKVQFRSNKTGRWINQSVENMKISRIKQAVKNNPTRLRIIKRKK